MIRVKQLSVTAGDFSLENISFEIPAGQYGILMGRTGSGKTTILETLCGLKRAGAGRILLMNRDVTHLKPAQRGIGFVPQDGTLFPTMTVRRQIGFALSVRKWKQRDINRRVDELAEMLEIRHLLSRTVEGISGGERQRIGLGRALAASPGVLCLDEPLSAVDEATRGEMYNLLKSVQRQTQVTTLHITHSRTEARVLGDVVLHLKDGEVFTVTDELSAESPNALPNALTDGHNGDGKQPETSAVDNLVDDDVVKR